MIALPRLLQRWGASGYEAHKGAAQRGTAPHSAADGERMSNTDSFFDEVTEEVRRDRLYGLFRRWAWLVVLVVIGIVGTAGWFEYSRVQDRAAAQSFGDAIMAALDAPDAAARVAALQAVDPATAEGRIVLALLAAGEVGFGEAEAAQAAADLRAAADGPGLPRRYRDLAMLKAEMIDPSAPETARLVLSTLAEPGGPYAALAEEQLALIDIRAGALPAALERLRSLERSAAATSGLQQRASQLIVALEAGSRLIETAPIREPVPDAAPTPAAVEPAAPAGVTGADDAAGDTAPAVQQ